MCSHGVKDHISAELEKIGVLVDDDGLVSSLKDMPRFLMSPVVFLGVHAVELSHPFREVCFRSFDDQVVVIVHEAVGVTEPPKPVPDAGEKIEEITPVLVALEDLLTGVASARRMIDSARVFDTKGTSPKWKYIIAMEVMLQ